jgi:hypothetical protein
LDSRKQPAVKHLNMDRLRGDSQRAAFFDPEGCLTASLGLIWKPMGQVILIDVVPTA